MPDDALRGSSDPTAFPSGAPGLPRSCAASARGDTDSSSPGAPRTWPSAGDACSYEGPTAIPAGTVDVNGRIRGQPRDGYALVIATLDEGETFEDLDAWPSTDQPPWLTLHAFQETPQSDPDDFPPFSAGERKGPIFAVCFTRDPVPKVGVLGPIEVEG